jgi:hypothetical protein
MSDTEDVNGLDQETPAANEEAAVESIEQQAGEKSESSQETEEQIRARRAYHQQQSQEKSEHIGELEQQSQEQTVQIDELEQQLEVALAKQATLTRSVSTAEPGIKAPETPEEIDYEDYDPATKALAMEIRGLRGEISDLKARDAESRQGRINSQYEEEVDNVNRPLSIYINGKLKSEALTADQVKDAIAFGRTIIPDADFAYLGAPTKRARVIYERLKSLALSTAHEKTAKARTRGTHEDKMDKMKATLQPVGGPVAAPGREDKSENDQRADDIVPDNEDFIPLE